MSNIESNIFEIPEFTPERARKYHYWRGFRSGVLIMLPIVLVLIYVLHDALNAMQ